MTPIEENAMRLVLEGRVHIRWRSSDAAHGVVDGDTATYQVSYSPAGRVCTCPAGTYHRICKHAIALELAAAAKEHEWQLT